MNPVDVLGITIFIVVMVVFGSVCHMIARFLSGLLMRWIDSLPEMDEPTWTRVVNAGARARRKE